MSSVYTKDSIGTLIARSIAEILGTAILMFIGCMGCMPDIEMENGVHAFLGRLNFGFGVGTAVQLFGHLSGAHFNLCVTLAAVIMKKIEYIMAPVYIACQTIGAFLGYGFLLVVTNSSFHDGQCVTTVHSSIEPYQAFLIELVTTGILVTHICAIWDPRCPVGDSAPIRVGITVATITITVAEYTGASLNPVRSFAPAAINNMWDNHWVYWTGPPLGGVVAALFYRFIFMEGLPRIRMHRNREQGE